MKTTISLILCVIFLSIAVIHFYWAFGGKLFLNAAIPTNEKSDAKVFSPSLLATLFVALIFCAFGVFILFKAGLVLFPLPLWISNYGLGFIAFIFFVRAIGDFKYAGFFKKIKNTLFAKMDTKYYSPLCLAVAVLIAILVFLK
jgi:glucan phosphoethanolaminetransferase (alkaline phosphatase superfamily)